MAMDVTVAGPRPEYKEHLDVKVHSNHVALADETECKIGPDPPVNSLNVTEPVVEWNINPDSPIVPRQRFRGDDPASGTFHRTPTAVIFGVIVGGRRLHESPRQLLSTTLGVVVLPTLLATLDTIQPPYLTETPVPLLATTDAIGKSMHVPCYLRPRPLLFTPKILFPVLRWTPNPQIPFLPLQRRPTLRPLLLVILLLPTPSSLNGVETTKPTQFFET